MASSSEIRNLKQKRLAIKTALILMPNKGVWFWWTVRNRWMWGVTPYLIDNFIHKETIYVIGSVNDKPKHPPQTLEEKRLAVRTALKLVPYSVIWIWFPNKHKWLFIPESRINEFIFEDTTWQLGDWLDTPRQP